MAVNGEGVSFETILTPTGAGPKGTNFHLAFEGERNERLFAGDGGTWIWQRHIDKATDELGHAPKEATVTITFR